jgi:hypothetical protein
MRIGSRRAAVDEVIHRRRRPAKTGASLAAHE